MNKEICHVNKLFKVSLSAQACVKLLDFDNPQQLEGPDHQLLTFCKATLWPNQVMAAEPSELIEH